MLSGFFNSNKAKICSIATARYEQGTKVRSSAQSS